MTFRLHHSVVLQCSIEKAWDVFASPEQFSRLQEALPSCHNCIIRSNGDATKATTGLSLPSKQKLLGILELSAFPNEDLPWPSIDESPEAVHFEFQESESAFVDGAQIAVPSHHTVFFHSRVTKVGIEEWKLRVLEPVDDGQVRVTETVWGTAPFLLSWFLKLTGWATGVHKQHMELYHTLASVKELM